jgi:hypothetical protein
MKASLPALKRRLKSLRAYWCELDEAIVATLKKDALLDYGVEKGILKIENGGVMGKNRFHYYFSAEKGLNLRNEMREKTCAFSGKSV